MALEVQLTKTRQRQPKGNDVLYIGITINTEMDDVEKSSEAIEYPEFTDDEKAVIDAAIALINSKVKPIVKTTELTQ